MQTGSSTLAKPIFVLGSPRSGTTMLAGILNQFTGVHVTKETGFIGDLYQSGMHWLADPPSNRMQRLIDETWSYLIRHGWNARPTTMGFSAFASANRCPDYAGFVRYCWQLEENISATRLKFLGDNTPRYTLAIPLLHKLFPNARYINLVRDGRDVVCSLINRHFGANSLLCAARSWMDHIGCWQMAERILPMRQRLELKYEDLVHDPDEARIQIGDFLECDFIDADLTLDSHGIAEQLGHHTRLDDPIDSSSVGRFVNDLSEKQIADIEAVMYPGLVAYDYQVGPFRPSAVMKDRSLLLTGSHVLDLMKRAVRKVQPCP